MPGGGQDGDQHRLHRRLVRRLHPEAVDRRVGRVSPRQRTDVRRERTRPRIRRHAGGADLARLHGARQRRLLRRLHRSRRPVPRDSVLRHLCDHGREHHAPNLGAVRVRIELGFGGRWLRFGVSRAGGPKLRLGIRRGRRWGRGRDQPVQQPVALRAAPSAAGIDWQSLRVSGVDINGRAVRAAKRTEAGSFVSGRVRHSVPGNPS